MKTPPVPVAPMHLSWKTRLEQGAATAIQWIASNQERFWSIVGAVAMAIVAGTFLITQRAKRQEDAWAQLGAVQAQSFQGKSQEALSALADWETRYSGTQAGDYARFMKADLLAKTTRYAEASAVYAELTERARPAVLRPLALSAQVMTTELAGQTDQARQLAQRFLEQYPDHFMAAPIHFEQARLAEKAQDRAAAAALYDRFTVLYPQSPWTELAKSRLAHPAR